MNKNQKHSPKVSPKKNAYLYMTHFFDEYVESEFLKLQAEIGQDGYVSLLYHRLPEDLGPPADYPAFIITDDDIDGLGFDMMQSQIVPGHLVFLAILFARAHPDFQYYWIVEQDVRFTGHWQRFFGAVNRSESDLLASHIRTYKEEPGWRWWGSFQFRDRNTDKTKLLRCFAPVFRLSNNALCFLDDSLNQGWRGHTEVLVPSLLYRNGFRLEDYGGVGRFTQKCNRRKHYASITLKDGRLMHGGTFNVRPTRRSAGWQRERLYHPVKVQTQVGNRLIRVFRFTAGRVVFIAKSMLWRTQLHLTSRVLGNQKESLNVPAE